MAPVLTDKPLTTVLRAAAVATGKVTSSRSTRIPPPQLIDLGTRLAVLHVVVSDIVAGNVELVDIRDEIGALLATPADDVQWDAATWRSLSDAVDRALPVALQVGPPMKSLAVLADKSRYLPSVADRLSRAAERAGSRYGAALRCAWRYGGVGVDAQLAAAAEAALGVQKLTTRLYAEPNAVLPQLATLQTLRDELLTAKQASHRSPVGTDPNTPQPVTDVLADIGIDSVMPGTDDWTLHSQLFDRYGTAWAAVQSRDPSADARVKDLNQRLQVATAMVTGAVLEEQLNTFRTAPELITVRANFDGYYQRLLPILAALHPGFAKVEAPGQVAAVAQLAAMVADEDLKRDTGRAITALKIARTVEQVLVTAAIAVAAAYTAGAASAFAAEALTLAAGEATIGGLSVVTVGTFAVEQMVLTTLTRVGNAAIFGSSEASTSFATDLLWNSIGGVFGKALNIGVNGVFGAVRTDLPKGLRALVFVGEQVSMYGFGQAQAYALNGHWAQGDEAARAALDQLVQLGMNILLGRLVKKLSEREPNLGIPAADLAAADLRNAELAVLAAKVEAKTATLDQQLALPDKIEEVRNSEVALIKALPDSAAKTAALDKNTREVADLELRMALAGVQAGLAPPGREPAASPVGPGVIAVSETGEPALERMVTEREGTVVDDRPPGSGLRKVTMPSGEVVFVADAGPNEPVPPPELLGPATVESLQLADVAEFGAEGMANLRRLFGKAKVEAILAGVRGTAGKQASLSAFLRLMAHPHFATATTVAAKDLIAIGRKPQLRDFAALYGPDVALALRRKLKYGGNVAGSPELADFARAETLLEGVPEGQRADFAKNSLVDADARAVRILVRGAAPAAEKPAPISGKDAGVNSNSKQWKAAYAQILKKYPNLPEPARRARASAQQMVELAQAGRYRTGKVSYPEQQRILLRLDEYCAAAEYSDKGAVGPWNRNYGEVIEWMLLPQGAANKTVWYKGSTKNIPQYRKGTSIPDGFQVTNGTGVQTEVKGNRIHTELVDPLDIADEHYDEAVADATNIFPTPENGFSRYEMQLHYFHIPTSAVMQAMIARYSRAGSPITRVKFGNGTWIAIKPVPPTP